MAEVKISDLTDGSPAAAGDWAEIEREGTPNVSRRVPIATAAQIIAATAKTTPHDNDVVGIADSEASNVLKKLSWANIKTALGSVFAAIGGSVSQAFAALTVDLGHESDTTLARFAAGVLGVEGKALYRDIPVQSKTANYTTVANDFGTELHHPSSDNNARTFTIDNDVMTVGEFLVISNAINTLTIAIIGGGATLRWVGSGSTGSRSLAANGQAVAHKKTSTEVWINGTGLT